jgi:hypothetical protein
MVRRQRMPPPPPVLCYRPWFCLRGGGVVYFLGWCLYIITEKIAECYFYGFFMVVIMFSVSLFFLQVLIFCNGQAEGEP